MEIFQNYLDIILKWQRSIFEKHSYKRFEKKDGQKKKIITGRFTFFGTRVDYFAPYLFDKPDVSYLISSTHNL